MKKYQIIMAPYITDNEEQIIYETDSKDEAVNKLRELEGSEYRRYLIMGLVKNLKETREAYSKRFNLNIDFYDNLSGEVCEILDKIVATYGIMPDFKDAWGKV